MGRGSEMSAAVSFLVVLLPPDDAKVRKFSFLHIVALILQNVNCNVHVPVSAFCSCNYKALKIKSS